MPERKVLQPEDSPRAILLDVLILIYTSLPPLYKATGVRVLNAFVGTGGHHAAEAAFGSGAFSVNVDNALHLGMI